MLLVSRTVSRGQGIVCALVLAVFVLAPQISRADDELAKGGVVAGSELDYPPYALVTAGGEADGFSVDLLKAVCEAAGIGVTIRVGPWAELRAALEGGAIDVLPLVSYSKERDETLDFTVPYAAAHGAVFKRKDAPGIETAFDLRDKAIIVMRGDAGHDWLIRNDVSDDLTPTPTVGDSLQLLASGKHDFVLAPRLVGLLAARRLGLDNIEMTGPLIDAYGRGYGFAVKAGRADLLLLLNEGLSVVRSSGRYDEIHAKWFGGAEPGGISRQDIVRVVLWSLAGVAVVVGIAMVWIVVLRRAVAARTRQLQEARNGLELAVAERTRELAERNTILDAVVDGAMETIFVKDRDGRFLLFNQGAAQRFGTAPSALLGKTVADLFPPAVADRMAALDRVVMETGRPWDGEETLTVRGRERIIYTYKTPFRNAEGAIIGVIGISRDVTKQRKLERDFESSQTRWRFALEGAGDGVWDWDCRTGTVAFSRQWKEMLGYEDAEIGGSLDEWRKRVHPDDLAGCLNDLDRHFRGETTAYVNEHRMLCRDGSYRWILDRGKVVERSEDGRPLRVIGTHTDITERKRMEVALDHRERYLRAILQTTVDAFWVLDVEGKFIDSNEAYSRMSGYSREEALALRIADVDVLEDPAATATRTRRIIENGSETFETRHRRKDGSILDVEVSATHLDIDGGRLICFCRDITERKRAEERVRDDARRLRSIVKVLQHGTTVIQEFLDYALGEALELVQSRFGYIYFYHEDRKEFVLNTWSKEVMTACAVAEPQTCYALDKTGIWGEAVRQRRPIILNDFVAQHPLKKGYPTGHVALTRFLTVPVFKGDHIVAVVGVANKAADYDEKDVLQLTLLMDAVWKSVEVMRAQEALRVSEERFAKAFRASPAPMSISTIGAGVLLEVNDEWLSMFGFERGEVIGKNTLDLDCWSRDRRAAVMERLRQDGSFRGLEATVRTKAGRERKVLLAGESIGDDRILLVFHDITERQEMENRLAHAQKMEAVGQLTSGIAHDFNNLLQVVLANIELVGLDLPESGQAHGYLARARSAVGRGSRLTQQLLSFARRQMLQPQPVDANRLIEDSVALLSRTLGEEVRIETILDARIAPILVDPHSLGNALLNLALNARAAMPGGGTLTFATRGTALREPVAIDDGVLAAGDYVEVAVSDTGLGMTRDVLEKAFEPFFTTKDVGEGSGLGLSMVYGFARQSGGRATLTSAPGKGTTVGILLPCVGIARSAAVRQAASRPEEEVPA
jgi:PAS domain S-box-containing protein